MPMLLLYRKQSFIGVYVYQFNVFLYEGSINLITIQFFLYDESISLKLVKDFLNELLSGDGYLVHCNCFVFNIRSY